MYKIIKLRIFILLLIFSLHDFTRTAGEQKKFTQTTPRQVNYNKILCLQQHDIWGCEYFTAFNMIHLYKILKKANWKNIDSILSHLDLSTKAYQKKYYDIFLPSIFSMYKDLKNLYYAPHTSDDPNDTKKQLRPDRMENVFLHYFGKSRMDEFENISIIEYFKLDEKKLMDGYILKNIKKFREKVPQIVVIRGKIHWRCCVFTENAIWYADSLSESWENKTLNPQKVTFIEIIYNLFASEQNNCY